MVGAKYMSCVEWFLHELDGHSLHSRYVGWLLKTSDFVSFLGEMTQSGTILRKKKKISWSFFFMTMCPKGVQ